MADIKQQCRGGRCPWKEHCLRYTADPDADWGVVPGVFDRRRKFSCTRYLPKAMALTAAYELLRDRWESSKA